MNNFQRKKSIRHQKGAALLLFFMALILAGITFILAVLPDNLQLKQQNKTTLALTKAKQALITFAVTNNYRTNFNTGTVLTGWHGYLPCPETTSGSEGSQSGFCNSLRLNAIGRLPWQTLNLQPLKDASGQCLWYAVSAAFKNGPKQMHNSDSMGMFDIFDTQNNKLNSDLPEDRIVAIIIAPGKQLAGQNRGSQIIDNPCGYANNLIQASDFLDSINNINNAQISTSINQVDSFAGLISPTELSSFNDRIITITRGEIFDAIYEHTKFSQIDSSIRVNALDEQLQDLGFALAQCLVNYATNSSNRLPWPGRVDMQSNSTVDDYQNNIRYIDQSNNSNGYLGRLPMQINNSNTGSSRLIDHCPTTFSIAQRNLWDDWKDHFFLVIGADFSPASIAAPALCTSLSCPTLNSVDYAALIIIANRAINNASLTQLRRDSDTETLPQLGTNLKGSISNYLEGVNATNYASNSHGTYSNIAGNDIFIAINTNMTITCFNLNTRLVDSLCPTLYQN